MKRLIDYCLDYGNKICLHTNRAQVRSQENRPHMWWSALNLLFIGFVTEFSTYL